VPLRVHLLASGPYITEFANSTFKLYADLYGLMALSVDLPVRPWPILIATLKNRTLSPVVERFIGCAREVAKSMTAKPDTRKSRSPGDPIARTKSGMGQNLKN